MSSSGPQQAVKSIALLSLLHSSLDLCLEQETEQRSIGETTETEGSEVPRPLDTAVQDGIQISSNEAKPNNEEEDGSTASREKSSDMKNPVLSANGTLHCLKAEKPKKSDGCKVAVATREDKSKSNNTDHQDHYIETTISQSPILDLPAESSVELEEESDRGSDVSGAISQPNISKRIGGNFFRRGIEIVVTFLCQPLLCGGRYITTWRRRTISKEYRVLQRRVNGDPNVLLVKHIKEQKEYYLVFCQDKRQRNRVRSHYTKFESNIESHVAKEKTKPEIQDNDALYIVVEKPYQTLNLYQRLDDQDIHNIVAGLGHVVRGVKEVHRKKGVLLDLRATNFYREEGRNPYFWKILSLKSARKVGSKVSIEELRSICQRLPPEILAAEQGRKEVFITQSLDIWLLGVLFYRTVTGRDLPDTWEGDTANLFEQKLQESVGYRQQLLILNRSMLNPNPSERPTAAKVSDWSVFR